MNESEANERTISARAFEGGSGLGGWVGGGGGVGGEEDNMDGDGKGVVWCG
jgi:hypothetical protein